MPPLIYRNESDKRQNSNYLSVSLRGNGKNTAAIGAEVTLYYDGKTNYLEQVPARGFQSTVDNRLHFGLDTCRLIDSLTVCWPDGKSSVLKKIEANQFLNLNEKESNAEYILENKRVSPTLFQKIPGIEGLDFIHRENDFADFDRDRLLFEMISDEGPHVAKGDVNGDGLADIYICGAKNSPGSLYIQRNNGHFIRTGELLFNADKISEDTDCAFFDADGDGDQDLYVASGGNEFPSSSSALSDRLYLNDGKGHFVKSPQILPAGKYESSSCVRPADFDKDGDIDLFIGIRVRPFDYGSAC